MRGQERREFSPPSSGAVTPRRVIRTSQPQRSYKTRPRPACLSPHLFQRCERCLDPPEGRSARRKHEGTGAWKHLGVLGFPLVNSWQSPSRGPRLQPTPRRGPGARGWSPARRAFGSPDRTSSECHSGDAQEGTGTLLPRVRTQLGAGA